MKCRELLAKLSDYLDGDIDRDIYEAFRAHLDNCSPCEIVIDNVRHTITLYKSGKPVELPAELRECLRRLLRDRWEAHFPASDAGR